MPEDFAWLLGIYAAEGCGMPYHHISKRGKRHRYYKGVYFTLSIKEFDLALKICNVVEQFYPEASTNI